MSTLIISTRTPSLGFGTITIAPVVAAAQLFRCTVLPNGRALTVGQWTIESVPAYNGGNTAEGNNWHRRGQGNGYVLGLGRFRIYVAGDTDLVPEMNSLSNITVAFLPVGLPWTMSMEHAAEAAMLIRPRVLYPYHYMQNVPAGIQKRLEGSGIDVRLRDWY